MRQPDSPWIVVIIVVSCTVIVTLSELVVRFDERRLSEERLERAWSPPSRDNALIGMTLLVTPLLGLFAVWFHFFRTRSTALWPPWRWSWRGLLLGLLAVLGILVIDEVVLLALSSAVGFEIE